ncbi:PD-(D/E)XK motif protein [Rubripirellula sp.]|nr:PD-(D/E)XK motif protein [Rubripirellula sp.]MDB4634103.1 PD-(D/E)XK motif protein [Rubripirellula sp.]
MTNDIKVFFQDDPWANINEPCYPDGRRLYLEDERFYVSMDDKRRLLFFVHARGGESVKPLENLEGLQVSIEGMKNGESRLVCILTDMDREMQDKFSTVAKDIAFHCSPFAGNRLFQKVQARIKSWANFLKPSRRGLTNSEFVGFFGELYSIAEQLFVAFTHSEVINGWIGPEGKKQDFSIGDVAVEIKASLSGDQQSVSVSSLDQLDQITEHLLLLRVIAAPAVDGEGVSLRELYESIVKSIEYDFATENNFLNKASVFYGKATDQQLNAKYKIIDESVYDVSEEFPKLTRGNVHNHIMDAKYSISVNAIEPFRKGTTVEEVLRNG